MFCEEKDLNLLKKLEFKSLVSNFYKKAIFDIVVNNKINNKRKIQNIININILIN